MYYMHRHNGIKLLQIGNKHYQCVRLYGQNVCYKTNRLINILQLHRDQIKMKHIQTFGHKVC